MTTEKDKEKGETQSELKEFLSAFEQSEGGTGGRSVLIVDDEQSVRRMVSRSMTTLDKDLKVYQAENGLEALDVLEKIRKQEGKDPVLIVTDLNMPIMDGWEFIEQLWKQFQEKGREFGIPLIVLSASTGEKGIIFGKSVHGKKCKYNPIVTIAKEDCIKPIKYDSQGEKGLASWIKYFLQKRDYLL